MNDVGRRRRGPLWYKESGNRDGGIAWRRIGVHLVEAQFAAANLAHVDDDEEDPYAEE